jgi:peptidoglycan-associated lipoprotein
LVLLTLLLGCGRSWSVKGSSFSRERPPDKAIPSPQESQETTVAAPSTPAAKVVKEADEISLRAEQLRQEAEKLAQETAALRGEERFKGRGAGSSSGGEGEAPSPQSEQTKETPTGFQPAPELSDIFFAYDQSFLSEEAQSILERNAGWLRSHSEPQILVEGHCDERGSVEYNLALGERRAQSVKDYLINMGIGKDRLYTISYGKERPFAFGHTEEAWAQNRRAHFLLRSP